MYGFVPAVALRAPAFAGAAVSRAPAPSTPARWSMAKSQAVPFLEAPSGLDPSAPGYAGFDPVNLSSYLDQDYARAGELKNGRVAMLACLGMLVQEFVHLPAAQFSESNPIKAAQTVPVEGWVQIITAISLIELATFKRTYEKGADLGFDPLGKKDSTMELKEVKNGRLAMLGGMCGERC